MAGFLGIYKGKYKYRQEWRVFQISLALLSLSLSLSLSLLLCVPRSLSHAREQGFSFSYLLLHYFLGKLVFLLSRTFFFSLGPREVGASLIRDRLEVGRLGR